MYISMCRVKREKNSKWEEALYVGEAENCNNSVILDKEYKVLDEVWDLKPCTCRLVLNLPIEIGVLPEN